MTRPSTPAFTTALSLLALLALTAWPSNVLAGQFNSVLEIGSPAPTWEGLPNAAAAGDDDKMVSLKDYANEDVLIVVFTCNTCPYAVDVEDRLIQLHKDFAEQSVQVVAINVNKIDEDGFEAMQEKAIDKQLPFAYLFDASQQIAKDFGAKYTPECFVLDAKRNVVYMGSMDDSPDGKNVQQPHVRNAIKAILDGGHPEVTETVPIGCRIRIERMRRKRTR